MFAGRDSQPLTTTWTTTTPLTRSCFTNQPCSLAFLVPCSTTSGPVLSSVTCFLSTGLPACFPINEVRQSQKQTFNQMLIIFGYDNYIICYYIYYIICNEI